MKWTALVAASAMGLTTLAAGAAPKQTTVENSTDVLRPQQLQKTFKRAELSPLLAPGIGVAAVPSVEDVGDPDSFGKNVTWLGLAQTQGVVVTADCTGSDPTVERCITAAPAPAATSFNEADLAVINLPARSTKSLVCFTLTPSVNVFWQNPLLSPATARFSANAAINIDNPVLDDPALIDPNTGLPFGGTLALGLSTFHDSHTLQPGEIDSKVLFMSRGCIAGLVSKRVLVELRTLRDAGQGVLQEADDLPFRRARHRGAAGLRQLLLRHPALRRLNGPLTNNPRSLPEMISASNHPGASCARVRSPFF